MTTVEQYIVLVAIAVIAVTTICYVQGVFSNK